MSKVLTFSRFFPAYHPKAGQAHFLCREDHKELAPSCARRHGIFPMKFSPEIYYIVDSKRHTIRSGNRWKVGDKFSPRVWSGKLYQSKQIIIAPDIEVKKVWPVEIEFFGGSFYVQLPVKKNHWTLLSAGDVAKNDGLEVHDFIDWL